MKLLPLMTLIIALVWCSGNSVLAAIGAPSIFSFAPSHANVISREIAGTIFGEVLRRWSMVIDVGILPLLTLLLCIFAGSLIKQRRIRSGVIILGMASLLIGMHTWSSMALDQALRSAPPIDINVAYSAEQRQAFNVLHHQSTQLYSCETVILLLIIVTFGFVLVRQDSRESASAASPLR